MARSGRASTGCANCKSAKKGCDQQKPTCGRCMRLNHTCTNAKGGLAGTSIPREDVLVKAHLLDPTACWLSGPAIQGLEACFFSNDWSFLSESFTNHRIVSDLKLACALVAAPDDTSRGPQQKQIGTHLYVQSLSKVRAAMLNPATSCEDATLVATMLLATFERLIRDDGSHGSDEWDIHVQGISCLVEKRGIGQVRTKLGRAIFRRARDIIIDSSFCRDVPAPPHVILYAQAVSRYPENMTSDQLAVLEARATALWARYRANKLDMSLLEDLEAFWEDVDNCECDTDLMSPRPNGASSLGNDQSRQHGLLLCLTCRPEWARARLANCLVVVLSIVLATRGLMLALVTEQRLKKKEEEVMQKGAGRLIRLKSRPFRSGLRSTAEELATTTTESLRLLSGLRHAGIPTASALCLTRLLYVVATALIESSRLAVSQQDWRLRGCFVSQVTIALEEVYDLGHKVGDRCALNVLQAAEMRWCAGRI